MSGITVDGKYHRMLTDIKIMLIGMKRRNVTFNEVIEFLLKEYYGEEEFNRRKA